MSKIPVMIFTVLFFSCTNSFAQHGEHDEFHAHHSLGLIISHTQVSEGRDAEGHKKWLALPSWGINYNYQFSKKWAIGLHSDIVTETFKVEEHLNGEHNEIIERSKPIATAVMASFKPGKSFSYLFGAGGEFAHSANYFLVRLGIEYGHHISNTWELNANITNDLKVNAYNSWAIGLGVTKIF